jgi:putative membrane protein
LFRREVYLTYRRIQDIHVTRNLLERWMGLARISLQTAAGSSNAEMVIEGNMQPEQLRDFLYRRMRGARNENVAQTGTPGDSQPQHALQESAAGSSRGSGDSVLPLLTDIRDALKTLAAKGASRP